MEVAEPGRRAAGARRTRLRLRSAFAAALPVLTVFVWLCLVYGVEAWGHPAPWLNSDEFEYAQLSRSIAATGHETWRGVPYSVHSLYLYLVAPAWLLHDTGQAYGVVKTIGVMTMTAVVFPVYLLARMLVSRRWALFAAAGAAVIPALAYSSMLLLEPLAYLWATLCFYFLARGLVTPRAGWIGCAVVTCAVAPLVREQLFVLTVGAGIAAVLFLFTGDRGRRLRRNWTTRHWIAFVAFVAVVVVAIDRVAVHESHIWALTTRTYPRQMVEFSLRSFGSLTIGLGVLPVIAGLTALGRSPAEPSTRERRAFTWLFVAMLGSFGMYAAVKAAYVPTLGATEVVERNLIYLAPLFFVGTAIVLERRRPALIPLGAATAFVIYLVTTTPYHMNIPVFFEAPGLAVLPGLNRGFGLTPVAAKVLLVVLALGFAVLLLFLRYGPRRAGATVAAVAAGVVLAWNVYGEVSFARESQKAASSQLDSMPRPLDWVDRAVPHGADVAYLGQSIDDPYDVLQLEFWNRRIMQVWSTDGTAPGQAVRAIPAVTSTGGTLSPSDVSYLVADSGIVPVGRALEQKSHHGGRGTRTWTLYRIAPPLRLRNTIAGVYADGWGKPLTALNQFSFGGNEPRIVKVHVFRTGAARLYPATVRVRVGTIGLVGGPTGALEPALASLRSTKTIRVANGLNHTFVFKAPPPPFRVETSVTPFPHSRDPVIGDPRDLGANIQYSVVPGS